MFYIGWVSVTFLYVNISSVVCKKVLAIGSTILVSSTFHHCSHKFYAPAEVTMFLSADISRNRLGVSLIAGKTRSLLLRVFCPLCN